MVTSKDGKGDSSENRNRGMDMDSNKGSSSDNRGTDNDIVQEGAAPPGEA
jgi:hypothetical protein